jgi:hypothetical protein
MASALLTHRAKTVSRLSTTPERSVQRATTMVRRRTMTLQARPSRRRATRRREARAVLEERRSPATGAFVKRRAAPPARLLDILRAQEPSSPPRSSRVSSSWGSPMPERKDVGPRARGSQRRYGRMPRRRHGGRDGEGDGRGASIVAVVYSVFISEHCEPISRPGACSEGAVRSVAAKTRDGTARSPSSRCYGSSYDTHARENDAVAEWCDCC